jgi:hypothetical protein
MDSSVFRDITPCSPLKVNPRFGIVYHEDGGDVFFRNASCLSTSYTALYFGRHNSYMLTEIILYQCSWLKYHHGYR